MFTDVRRFGGRRLFCHFNLLWQLAGFHSLRVQTLDKVKKALILVEEELRETDIFLDFFEFAFKFCLTVSPSTEHEPVP